MKISNRKIALNFFLKNFADAISVYTQREINYMCVQRVLFIFGNQPNWASPFLIVLDSHPLIGDQGTRISHQEGLFG